MDNFEEETIIKIRNKPSYKTRLFDFFIPYRIEYLWKIYSNKLSFSGVSKEHNDLIVSLTSWKKRINTAFLAIRSLMLQTYKPEKILLWLSEEEFPSKEEEIPSSLLDLQEYGLEIKWCDKNLLSHKKLIYSIQEFPNHSIVTADDDLYYRESYIEDLYSEYLKYPEYIHCHRGLRIFINSSGKLGVIKDRGYNPYMFPTILNEATCGGGALFPPNSLYKDFCNEKFISKLSLYSSDLWFWAMSVLKGTKTKVTQNFKKHLNLLFIKDTQKNGLDKINTNNENNSEILKKQIFNVILRYPQIYILAKGSSEFANSRISIS